MSGRTWDEDEVAERWIEAQERFGDLYRRQLIGPLVVRVCDELARGRSASAFSVYDALQDICDRNGRSRRERSGVRVVDVGAGEGWMGAAIGPETEYVALESSPALVAAANRRLRESNGRGAVMKVPIAVPDAATEDALARALEDAPVRKTLITFVSALERMKDPRPLFAFLSSRLRSMACSMPVLVVTLDADHFHGDMHRESSRYGSWEIESSIIPWQSIGIEVHGYLRSHRWYEELFRDTGFFVERIEPLHFTPNLCGNCDLCRPKVPLVRANDVFRLPTFWSWTVSPRRGRPLSARVSRSILADVVEQQGAARGIDPGDIEFIEFERDEPIIRSGNLGGELVEIVRGDARLTEGSRSDESDPVVPFPNGTLLGDLEATGTGGPQPFSHDVVAGLPDRLRGGRTGDKCIVAILKSSAVERLLPSIKDGDGLAAQLYLAVVDRLQLDVLKNGGTEPNPKWPSKGKASRAGGSPSIALDTSPNRFWRLARALLWASAIERRLRSKHSTYDVAFVDMDAIAAVFHPSAHRHEALTNTLRSLQALRIVDALPFCWLTKECGSAVEKAARNARIRILVRASKVLLRTFEHADRRDLLRLALVASGLATTGKRAQQAATKELIAEASTRVEQQRLEIRRWHDYFRRLQKIWTSFQAQSISLVVLRDVAALRRLARGGQTGVEHVLVRRAHHLLPTGQGAPEWKDLAAQANPGVLVPFVLLAERFFSDDLQHEVPLLFSHDLITYRRPTAGDAEVPLAGFPSALLTPLVSRTSPP